MLCYLIIFTILLYGTNCQENEDGLFTSPVLRRNDSKILDYEDSTYFFNTEFQVNFFTAFTLCKNRNMQLVSIESAEENNKIGLYLVEKGFASHKFWISGVNLVDSRKWTWLSTGKEAKYFNWDAGEPTGNNIPLVANYENCIQARHEGNRGFTWNDLNCGIHNYFICEAPTTCSCISPRAAF